MVKYFSRVKRRTVYLEPDMRPFWRNVGWMVSGIIMAFGFVQLVSYAADHIK